MHISQLLAVASTVLAVADAWTAPVYSGWDRAFQSNFVGPKGNQPNQQYWKYITGDKNDNNEFQRYTSDKGNLQLSGSGTLQIVPWRNSNAPKGWTSARIETKYTVTPQKGKIMRVEAAIRLGDNSAGRKQGLWPAFWMMGDAFRNGVAWPQAGEVDIFENINGESIVHGVVHCGTYPNGPCNEPVGLVETTPLSDSTFHVYRVEFDRRSGDWRKQSITWYKDGKQFHHVSAASINDLSAWASLCHKPMYFILNVAVGGNWPGAPNSQSLGGVGAMMEIGYVAHYYSK